MNSTDRRAEPTVASGWSNGVVVFVLPVIVLVGMGILRRWTALEQFISYRALNNLFAGNGPSFNAGERVEVFRSPLWFSMLALINWPLHFIWGEGEPLEWTGVLLSLVFSASGLLVALLGSRRLWRLVNEGSPLVSPSVPPLVPIGAFVWLSLSAVWDFATSGLETGLEFGWLGVSFYLLVRQLEAPATFAKGWRPLLVLGLGALIGPGQWIASVAFVAIWLWLAPVTPARAALGASTAFALPAGYQLFRMGYFGQLMPTIALADEAFAGWTRGTAYLLDMLNTYWLWIPLLFLGDEILRALRFLRLKKLNRPAVLLAGLAAASGAEVLDVVRAGGNFMHARMLLPALFLFLMPVAVVSGRSAGRWLVVTSWAIVSVLWLRPPLRNGDENGIYDERSASVQSLGDSHPVTLDAYAAFDDVADGKTLRSLSALAHPPQVVGLTISDARKHGIPDVSLPLLRPLPVSIVAARENVAILGDAAGTEVWVADVGAGATSVLTAHAQLRERVAFGSEKRASAAWSIARLFYVAFTKPSDWPEGYSYEGILQAKAALACGDLGALRAAIEEPLTWGRFWRNVWLAPRLTSFRYPGDPAKARTALCGDRSFARR